MTQQIQRYEENIKYFSTLPYKDGEYKSRAWGHPLHFLLSYPSKLKPSIAHYLVKLFTKPGQIVLDPFIGSGTTMLAAKILGRKCTGVDLDPSRKKEIINKIRSFRSSSTRSRA